MPATKASQAKSGQKKVEAAYKQQKALDLRVAGHTLAEIAADLNYADESGAWRAIKAGIDNVLSPIVDEYRAIQGTRLEALWKKAWQRINAPGALPAKDLTNLIHSLLNIHKQIADLYGLNMPVKVAPTDPTGEYEYSGLRDSEVVSAFLELVRRRESASSNPPGA